MTPEQIQSFLALVLGFAFAGLLRHGLPVPDQASGELPPAAARAGAVGLRRGALPGLRRALHHHAQHLACAPSGRPPLRIRHGRHHPRRILEHDVGHRDGHGGARARLLRRLIARQAPRRPPSRQSPDQRLFLQGAQYPLCEARVASAARPLEGQGAAHDDLRARRAGAGTSRKRAAIGSPTPRC